MILKNLIRLIEKKFAENARFRVLCAYFGVQDWRYSNI